MYDILPFPNIIAGSAEEQTAQINNYLIQLKETLEFILTNISVENLSQDLIAKLNTLGADIEKSNVEREDQLNQIANKTLSVSDVINSQAFKVALDNATPDEYLVSAEQIQSSEEAGGINIYAIENESGEMIQLTIKNGKDGSAAIILPITNENSTILVVEPRVLTKSGVGISLPAGYIEEGEEKTIVENYTGNDWRILGVGGRSKIFYINQES